LPLGSPPITREFEKDYHQAGQEALTRRALRGGHGLGPDTEQSETVALAFGRVSMARQPIP
jgi:hypothetical protein